VANKQQQHDRAAEQVKEDRRRFLRRAGAALGSAGLVGCAAWLLTRDRHRLDPRVRRSMEAARYTAEVVHTYPHDPGAFTQGLVFDGGFLYEGTGQYGESRLRKAELKTGRVLRQHNLEKKYFGEGIAVVGDRIIQLTWENLVGFVYDKNTFGLQKSFPYVDAAGDWKEGWGLAYDGTHLIVSDGSKQGLLRFLNPETFEVVRRLQVRDDGIAVRNLNELEYVEGEIYANVWYEDFIARIDPRSGDVTGWINLTELYPPQKRQGRGEDVLNGIAYDAKDKRLFVTGKYWPHLYEIRVVPVRP
jgi:glutaminyl-peptide cyclotransferase